MGVVQIRWCGLLLGWTALITRCCIAGQVGRRPFELVYHGQFDDSRPSNNVRITGRLELVALRLCSKCCFLSMFELCSRIKESSLGIWAWQSTMFSAVNLLPLFKNPGLSEIIYHSWNLYLEVLLVNCHLLINTAISVSQCWM